MPATAPAFAPSTGWPDNANLDKARRLLWPVKQKYGRKISGPTSWSSPATSPSSRWASRPSASEFGRENVWEPEEIFWGPEDTWLGDRRYGGDGGSAGPFGAVQMGLIYMNPEVPTANRILWQPPGTSGRPSGGWR